MKDQWAVTVERNGEKVVTIESNCLSGRDLSPEDEDAIRTAAQHLLSFVGPEKPAARPVGLDWEISQKTLDEIAEIDRRILR